MKNIIYELLSLLCDASDLQIDKTIVAKLELLKEEDIVSIITILPKILNECARYSLASDFAMGAMDALFQIALKEIENDASSTNKTIAHKIDSTRA